MKPHQGKYSTSLSIRSDVRTKPEGFRHRRIPTSRVVLYCVKRSLRKCCLTLSHIGHTRINNGFFMLFEALLKIQSCFSHSINVRGLPLSAVTVTLHYLTRCLRSTVTCNKTPTIVTWSEHLKICCHVIVAQ